MSFGLIHRLMILNDSCKGEEGQQGLQGAIWF